MESCHPGRVQSWPHGYYTVSSATAWCYLVTILGTFHVSTVNFGKMDRRRRNRMWEEKTPPLECEFLWLEASSFLVVA